MTQEEKLQEAKRLYKTANSDQRYVLESLFPELKESEDERIRKEIIVHIKWCEDNGYCAKEEMTRWIDFLKKQGEQKPADNVEPKFKVGDTVTVKPMSCHGKVFKGKPFKIVDIIEDNYVSDDGKTYSISLQDGWELVEQKPTDKVELKFKVGDWVIFAENHNSVYQVERIDNNRYYLRHYLGGTLSVYFDNDLIRLWTIQDAKDGDVLVNGSNIFIFHFLNDTRLMGYCHVNTDNRRFYVDLGKNECFCLIDAVVTPATKEQRDLLFSKMKEKGYEWDAEKKELSKRVIDEGKAEMDYCFTKMMNSEKVSSTWGKEDEQNLNAVLSYINDEYLCRWLKDVIHVKYDNPAWSEEDEDEPDTTYGGYNLPFNKAAERLKSLKDRIGG